MLTEGTNLICYLKPPNHTFNTNIIPVSSISLSLHQDNRCTSEFEFSEKSPENQLKISINKSNGEANNEANNETNNEANNEANSETNNETNSETNSGTNNETNNETTGDMKQQVIEDSEGKYSLSSSVHWLICEVFQVDVE